MTHARGRDYYEDRLKRDFPAHYADLKAGIYKSVMAAATAAGLKKAPTSLTILKREWVKASAADQDLFRKHIGCLPSPAPTKSVAPAPQPAGLIFGPDGRLTNSGKMRITSIMDRRGLENGDVMREIKMRPENTSMMMAMSRDTKLQQDLLQRLQKWVEREEGR